MKKPQAQKPKMGKARKPAGVPTISFGTIIPLCDGRAAVTFNASTIDGRYRGWLCHLDGTRIERVTVADLAGAEARAQQLIDKGAI